MQPLELWGPGGSTGCGVDGRRAHPPVWDVSGAHHGGDVDHRVPGHAGTIHLRILTNQVAGEEATVGTTHKGHSAFVKVFFLEYLLYCKLQGGAEHTVASCLPSSRSHTLHPFL